jgi:hypothetical protein
MRLFVAVNLGFVVVCFLKVVVAQEVSEEGIFDEEIHNVCDGIACSGHGKCVEIGGNPVCACSDGYMADQRTGLSCIPLAAKMDRETNEIVLEQTFDSDSDSGQLPVCSACFFDGQCRLPARCDEIKKTRTVPGTILTPLGSLLVVIGLPMGIVYTVQWKNTGYSEADVRFDQDIQSLRIKMAIGWVMTGVGLFVLVPGAVLLRAGVRDKKKVNPLSGYLNSRKPVFRPILSVQADGAFGGIGGSF